VAELIVDPFGPGVEVGARIQSIEFEAFLWLLDRGSLESRWCKKERIAARKRRAPMFVIRQTRIDVPKEFRERIALDRFALGETEFRKKAEELARAVSVRASLYRAINAINPSNPPEMQEERAQFVAGHDDLAAIAELLDLLDAAYRSDIDTVARHWLAVAAGGTRTPKAAAMLDKWRPFDDHPFAWEGIREGLEMCRR